MSNAGHDERLIFCHDVPEERDPNALPPSRALSAARRERYGQSQRCFLARMIAGGKKRIGFSPIRESFHRLIVRVFPSVIVR